MLDETTMDVRQNEDGHQMEQQNGTDCDCDGLCQRWHYKAICVCKLYDNGVQKKKEIFFFFFKFFYSSSTDLVACPFNHLCREST